jgi:AraC family transcriptional regulator
MITGVANPQKIPVAYQRLYESPLLRVAHFCCHSHESGPAAEEESESNSITLMRYGAFAKHLGKRRVTADVNQAVFFSKGSVYRISHPAGPGDRGTSFLPAPRVLNELIRELDPTVDERPERPFSFVAGPCNAQLFWRYRELIRRLEAAPERPLEPLWADVTVLRWIAELIAAALKRHQRPVKSRRTSTTTEHAEKAEAARAFLASRLAEPLTLTEVAREVGASPFHFARIFQQHAGLPVHRYLTLLRLRAALERLADGVDDLTGLALELGFSSHSHFSDLFRREFGQTPSAARKPARAARFREMRKNLIAELGSPE